MSELQGELHATTLELHRQLAMTATMTARMQDAEAAAAGAQQRVSRPPPPPLPPPLPALRRSASQAPTHLHDAAAA